VISRAGPKPLTLEYAQAARKDLDDIAAYYVAHEAWVAALDVPERIVEAAKLLREAPKAWPLGVSGHRERILSDLPFRIVYELLPDEEYPRTVRVLAFKHTAQLWPPSKPGDPR